MPRISLEVAYHKLALDLGAKLVKQKRKNHGAKRSEVIKVEVNKLLKSRFIREVNNETWLANVVLVKKQNEG